MEPTISVLPHNNYTLLELLPVSGKNIWKATYTKNDGTEQLCCLTILPAGKIEFLKEALEQLAEKGSGPKLIDTFERDGDMWIVTEWMEGEPLDKLVHSMCKWRKWTKMYPYEQLKVVGYIINCVEMLLDMHRTGFVHGKVRPRKFLVRDNKLYLVHYAALLPLEPGSADLLHRVVFDIGMMIIHLLTDYAPVKFDWANKGRLQASLNFQLADVELVSLLLACVGKIASARPALENLLQELRKYQERIAGNAFINGVSFTAGTLTNQAVKQVLMQSITMPVTAKSVFGALSVTDWYKGVAGLNYVTARCPLSGVHFRKIEVGNVTAVAMPGLYRGLAGIAVTLMATGNEEVEGWFVAPEGLSVAGGAAGQGLAAIHAVGVLGVEKAKQLATPYLNYLLDEQRADGGWHIEKEPAGFSEGVAGIACFLWLYHFCFGEQRAADAAEAAMKWLNPDEAGSVWFSNGLSGIVFTYITAYRISGREEYRVLAEKTLDLLPEYLHSSHFGFLNGITGLGETYLEAWQVFQDVKWKNRAHAIVNELMHMSIQSSDGYYWITESETRPLAGLLTGNAGILHFLMRYLSNGSVPHLLLPFL